MNKEEVLLTFISKFDMLTPEEVQAIADNITVQHFRKGAILHKQGNVFTQCFFVLQGCVRQYIVTDDKEKTTAFFTEEQAVVDFTSYSSKTPSAYSFSCVEDTLLIVGGDEDEQAMYEKFPKLQGITRMMMEQDHGRIQENFAAFIASSPEERYLNLMEARPELLQRVPQHQIASYLSMTPESLSRIRKRLTHKK